MMDGRIGKIRNSLDKKILKMLVLFRMQLNMRQVCTVLLEMQ